jgi:hypothetical protein
MTILLLLLLFGLAWLGVVPDVELAARISHIHHEI